MSSVLAEDFFEKIGLAPSTHHLFFPILIMIEDPASEISVFFDSSLKSWVLLLSVPPGRSLYTDLAGNEQLEFLLKISVITRENDQKLEPYQFFTKKQSESVDSFKNEAELQQNISVDSARYGSDEICPPVTSFAILAYNPATASMPEGSAGIEFLSILKNKAIHQHNAGSEKVLNVVGYLRDLLMRRIFRNGPNKRDIVILGLGVIVMPREVGSITMSDYIKSLNHAPIPYTVLAQQAASVLQLVIKQKVIPFDLHTKNQLIDGNLSVKIIDFGRSVGVKTGDAEDEDFLTNSHKATILSKITQLEGFEPNLNWFESHVDTREEYDPRNKQHKRICDTIFSILLWVREIELMGSRRRFPGREPTSRLGFIMDIEKMAPEERCHTLYTAFKIFISSNAIHDPELTHSAIETLTGQGRIIGFGGLGPEAFVVTEIPDNIGGFDISIDEPPTPSAASGFSVGNSDGSELESTLLATESYTPFEPFTPSPFTTASASIPLAQHQLASSVRAFIPSHFATSSTAPGGANLEQPPAQNFASLFSPTGQQFGHNPQFGQPNGRGLGGAMSRNKKRTASKRVTKRVRKIRKTRKRRRKK